MPVDEKRVREAVANRKKYRDVNTKYNLWIAGTAAVVLAACAAVLYGPDTGPLDVLVNDPSFITHLNRNAQGWQAGKADFFQGWTIGDVQKLLAGVKVSNQAGGLTECTLPDVVIPRSFDARERWPQCFPGVYDMGNCSASWAIAAASSMASRLCIANPENAGLELSVQQLLSCERKFGKGCEGGMLDMVWNYMKQDGLVSSTCFPYQANGSTPCSFCKDEEPKKLASICRLSTVKSIRQEIFLNGPVVAPVTLMNDFLVYRSGIYKATHTASQFVDLDRQPQLLAVKVIGWGVDEKLGREFWIIENSFGKDWGENGYAKIELSEGGQSILLSVFAFAGTPVNPKVLKLQKGTNPVAGRL